MKKILFICFASMLVLTTGCGSSKESSANTQSSKQESNSSSNISSNNDSNNEEEGKESNDPNTPAQIQRDLLIMSNARNILVRDIANNGFTEIQAYLQQGTGNYGKEIDIDTVIQNIEKAVEKRVEYDQKITELGPKFDKAAELWAKVSEETDKLLKVAKDNPIKPLDTDSKFDITAFKTVAEEFNDEFKAIYEEVKDLEVK
ncbi:hypothetical protein J2Z32_002711 [Paenibacillus turicensis]|uniref:Lipoprotein n=1 Tax=Paenibacillus turicensis TaxID=160487 RepID=A0ABS4FU03_9BACL|nr:hypothetical protein [Paenibacillus turicensis]MBP1906062.1 hypothetical protein [Paenibacillus turicensis]